MPKKTEEVVKPQLILKNQRSPQAKTDIKNEVFLVLLSDGQKISVEYSVTGTEKSIKGVSDHKDISYDISPSKKSIVIQSKRIRIYYILM